MNSIWIKNNLFTKVGKFNNRVNILSWWINRKLLSELNEIKEITNFLPENSNISRRIYHIIHEINFIPKCYCGNIVNFKQYHSGYTEYCSLNCSYLSEKRNLKISKNRNMEQIIEKCISTNMVKYGVPYTTQTQNMKDKTKFTKYSRYGNEFYNNSENNENSKLFSDPDYQKILLDKKIEKYGYNGVINFKGNNSKPELDILSILNETKYKFERNISLLKNREIDAYCEELKLGIEYCGLYWHSEQWKTNDYHFLKMKSCENLGIQLITIFEDEWLYRKEQVINFIRAKIGVFEKRIFARNCEFIKLDENPYSFFDKNHIQGSPNTIDKSFGLIDNNEIIGCVSFSKHHRNNDVYVLNRLAFKDNIQCVGGASKLIKNALNIIDKNEIITWSDNRWTNGELYNKCGFSFDGHLLPDYSYIIKNNRTRKNKQSMKKSNIGCPENMTEHEFCLSNKIYRIYDCGKKRWKYKKENIEK